MTYLVNIRASYILRFLLALQFLVCASFLFLPSQIMQWMSSSAVFGLQIATAASLITKIVSAAPPRHRASKMLELSFIGVWLLLTTVVDLFISGALDGLGGPNL